MAESYDTCQRYPLYSTLDSSNGPILIYEAKSFVAAYEYRRVIPLGGDTTPWWVHPVGQQIVLICARSA